MTVSPVPKVTKVYFLLRYKRQNEGKKNKRKKKKEFYLIYQRKKEALKK